MKLLKVPLSMGITNEHGAFYRMGRTGVDLPVSSPRTIAANSEHGLLSGFSQLLGDFQGYGYGCKPGFGTLNNCWNDGWFLSFQKHVALLDHTAIVSTGYQDNVPNTTKTMLSGLDPDVV
ncbi:hypothetical protein V6N13_078448 [Hibiscus sabdariffa]